MGRDDRQLAAIDAGGILRNLVETTGAVTLTAAVRFSLLPPTTNDNSHIQDETRATVE